MICEVERRLLWCCETSFKLLASGTSYRSVLKKASEVLLLSEANTRQCGKATL